jgi:peptide/nickel transport system permease protein
VTGFYTIDSILTGRASILSDTVQHLALPVLVLALVNAPGLARIMSKSLGEALNSDYIMYARATGLKSSVIARYAVRNALPPVVTTLGTYYVYLLGGAVLIEQIFSWGGVGQYAVSAVVNTDFDAIRGFVLFAATFSVIIYLLVDLVHLALDPRVA